MDFVLKEAIGSYLSIVVSLKMYSQLKTITDNKKQPLVILVFNQSSAFIMNK